MSHDTAQIRQYVPHVFDEDEQVEHHCYPDKPAHEQAEIFINGKFTSVDIKLEWLIRTFCAHGFTTRFSCQGFKSLKKARKAGFGDDRAYIMFEGESFYEMIQRLAGDVYPFNTAEELDAWAGLTDALVTRDDTVIASASGGSRWAIEFVSENNGPVTRGPRFGSIPRASRPATYHTVVRFPREDLEGFRSFVERIFQSGVEL